MTEKFNCEFTVNQCRIFKISRTKFQKFTGKGVAGMSDEQKYHEILKEIGRLIKEKNDEISLKTFQIASLRSEIQKAEEQKKGV